MSISSEQITAFYEQGYFVMPSLFSVQEITEMREASQVCFYSCKKS